MDENDIYAALGMTPPAAGQDSQETAPPAGQAETPPEGQGGASSESSAAETDASGAEDQDPQAGTGEEQDAPGGPEGASETGKPSGQEQDAAALEARWRALAAQAAQRAVEEERARNQAQWNDFFASAGLKNNLEGGKPITSLEEFRQWKEQYDRTKLEQDLKDGKLTPEGLEAIVRAAVGRRTEPVNQTPEQAMPIPGTPMEVTQAQIDAELAEIHRLDGSVNGLEDILRMETGGAFQDAVRRGHSFLDAFKLANFDRLRSRAETEAAARAAQAARNSARSKEHLKASSPKGNGSTPVPGDVMEIYRLMMPGASEADIQSHYNRTLKETEHRGGQHGF